MVCGFRNTGVRERTAEEQSEYVDRQDTLMESETQRINSSDTAESNSRFENRFRKRKVKAKYDEPEITCQSVNQKQIHC